ncbi:MAG: hypothetical protein WD575_01355, partial [Nitriliruptoraceae bacterium]
MDPNTASWALVVALFLPLAGAGLIALLPGDLDRMIRRTAVWLTGVPFALVVAIAAGFDYSRSGELQFVTDVPWIPAINARFELGIDGISMPLFFLTYLLT